MAEILENIPFTDNQSQKQPKVDTGDTAPAAPAAASSESDLRTLKDLEADNALARRLSSLVEDANSRVAPLTQMIRKNIEAFDAEDEDDRNEADLIKQVRPPLEQAEKILNETNGAIRGADPDGRLTDSAKRNVQEHKASKEEERLAEALKVMVEQVGGTIDWTRNKIVNFPKAKRDSDRCLML